MTEAEFKSILHQEEISVVHFSHCAVMKHRVPFPIDLEHALENPKETRSCCAIFPNYKMTLPGSVGIIYEPSLSDVLSVFNSDSGSSDHDGIEGSFGEKPTKATVKNSLKIRNQKYNEWRVIASNPVGVFIHDTQRIMAKQNIVYNVGGSEYSEIVESKIEINTVFRAFPKLPVYTMGAKGLEQVHQEKVI